MGMPMRDYLNYINCVGRLDHLWVELLPRKEILSCIRVEKVSLTLVCMYHSLFFVHFCHPYCLTAMDCT